MRTIKFKAKKVDNGEWVYGNVFVPDQMLAGVYICPETNIFDFAPGVNEDEAVDIKEEMKKGCTIGRFIEVLPETVCQFTGLLDHNGVEIYEGDVLKSEIYGSGVVEWDNEKSGFDVVSKEEERSFVLSFGEVMGNIHDK